MEYQNTKTGFILNTPCKITGVNWVPINGETIAPDEPVTPTIVPAVNVTPVTQVQTVSTDVESIDDEGISGITVKQIKQELEAFGVEYDPKAKKQVLYDLMMQHG